MHAPVRVPGEERHWVHVRQVELVEVRVLVDRDRVGVAHVKDAHLAVLARDEEVLALSRVGCVEREVAEPHVVEARLGRQEVVNRHILRDMVQDG